MDHTDPNAHASLGTDLKQPPSTRPTLLGRQTIAGTTSAPSVGHDPSPKPYFASAQWTADGTSIVTSSSDNTISTFVLPSTLGHDASDEPHSLGVSGRIKLPEPTQAFAIAPYFNLGSAASQMVLTGCRDHPLHLYHALPDAATDGTAEDGTRDPSLQPGPIASYRLIQEQTEAYIFPSSLLWPRQGSHFMAGSSNRIDLFDITQHGASGAPLLSIPTIPSKRHIAKGGGVGMKGTVAALADATEGENGLGLQAAGTWTRWLGLYDVFRSGSAVANWSVSDADRAEFQTSLGGQGIVQLVWSRCGRYLVVNERHAEGLLLYDVRGAGKLVGILHGRVAGSQQRLSCDVYQGSAESGFEVWAGSRDGTVQVWQGVGQSHGVVEPDYMWKLHNAPVGTSALHGTGTVLATVAGGWKHSQSTSNIEAYDDSSLNVWSVNLPAQLTQAQLAESSIGQPFFQPRTSSPLQHAN